MLELLVELRRDGDMPLHRQLEQELRDAIRSGASPAAAARCHRPAPWPTSSACLAGRRRRGLRAAGRRGLPDEPPGRRDPRPAAPVSAGAPTRRATDAAARPARSTSGYGRPDLTAFPRAAWLRSLRRVLDEAPSDGSATSTGAAPPSCARPSPTTSTGSAAPSPTPTGSSSATASPRASALVDPGARASAGARRSRSRIPARRRPRAPAARGLRIVPVPVDGDGIASTRSRAPTPTRVVVTPAHQFPTGAVLSRRAPRRARRLGERPRRARSSRTTTTPSTATTASRSGRSRASPRSASSTPALPARRSRPGLRLGWLVVAGATSSTTWSPTKQSADRGSPSLEQLAFADFLARGEFDHHLRRMRPIYRAGATRCWRRSDSTCPGSIRAAHRPGLHVVAWLPPGVEEAPLVDHAAARGVAVTGWPHYHHDPASARHGLLFGYGRVTEGQIEDGIRIVASALG